MKQKVVATIEARMGSTRLPNKVMLPITGELMLAHIVNRLKAAKAVDKIIIATSTNVQDKILVKLAKKLRVGWYQGSETDVLSRVLGAAKKYQGTHIVECWGDCPMVDPELIDQVVREGLREKVDFAANNTLQKSTPIGLDVMMFPTKVLQKVSDTTNDPYDHEHVSLYIYEHPKIFKLLHVKPIERMPTSGIRLVVDTEKDYELVLRLYHLLYKKNPHFGHREILELHDKFPKLFEINQDIIQKNPHYTKKDEKVIKNKLIQGQFNFHPKYRAGIVGCGNIAGLFSDDPKRTYIASHAEAYQLFPNISLVSVADIDKAKTNWFSTRWDVKNTYDDYKKMFEEEHLDIVSICTKPELHLQVLTDAIKAGIKHVVCEKPFGVSVLEAELLAKKAKKAGVHILVHYNRRFDPLHQALQEEIQKGHFGKLIGGIHYYCNGFINNGCHAVNLIQMLFGDIESVQVVGTDDLGGAVNFDVALTLATGQRIILKSVTGKNYIFDSDFLFEKSRIRIENVGGIVREFQSMPNPVAAGVNRYSDEPKVKLGKIPESLPEVLATIALPSKTRQHISTPEQASLTLEVLIACFISAKKYGKVVSLPLSMRDKKMKLIEQIKSK